MSIKQLADLNPDLFPQRQKAPPATHPTAGNSFTKLGS